MVITFHHCNVGLEQVQCMMSISHVLESWSNGLFTLELPMHVFVAYACFACHDI